MLVPAWHCWWSLDSLSTGGCSIWEIKFLLTILVDCCLRCYVFYHLLASRFCQICSSVQLKLELIGTWNFLLVSSLRDFTFFIFLLVVGICGWQKQAATSLVMLTTKFKFRIEFEQWLLKIWSLLFMMPHIMKPFALDTTFIVHDAYFNIIFMHSSFCCYNFHIYSFVETFIF